MMATDFAVLLHRFLTSHLAGLRGCSPNTSASYRDPFKLLIAWFRDHKSIPPDKPAPTVSALPDLTVGDIRLQPPALAVLTGKGRKIRHVPLGDNTAALLNAYLTEHGLDTPGHDEHPLFTNQHHSRLSRSGIA